MSDRTPNPTFVVPAETSAAGATAVRVSAVPGEGDDIYARPPCW